MAQTNNKPLDVGEKYLAGTIGGKDGLKIAMFPNRNKKPGDKSPDYIGNIQISIWVNEKKEAHGRRDSPL